MKRLVLSIIFMVFITAFFAQTGTVVIKVSGIENNKGVVRIGLYNNAETFPIYEKFFKGKEPKANVAGVNVIFINIPVGIYAIGVWQDKNEDKVLNKNIFGVPTENYGFSKNIYGTFGPPNFEKVSFKVNPNKKTILKIKID